MISLINGIDRLIFIKSGWALFACDFGVSVLKRFRVIVEIRLQDSGDVNLIIDMTVRFVVYSWILAGVYLNYAFLIVCNVFTWLAFYALISFGLNFNWKSFASVVLAFWVYLIFFFFVVQVFLFFVNCVDVCFLVNR